MEINANTPKVGLCKMDTVGDWAMMLPWGVEFFSTMGNLYTAMDIVSAYVQGTDDIINIVTLQWTYDKDLAMYVAPLPVS